MCTVSVSRESTLEKLTQQAVLLYEGLSVYPLMDLCGILVVNWITENDLVVWDERREDGGEEDKREQSEHSHRGRWERSKSQPASVPFMEHNPRQ